MLSVQEDELQSAFEQSRTIEPGQILEGEDSAGTYGGEYNDKNITESPFKRNRDEDVDHEIS